MSTDLRDRLEQAYSLEDERVPAASTLWRRGRLRRRRRTATSLGVGAALVLVAGMAVPRLTAPAPAPYVDDAPRIGEAGALEHDDDGSAIASIYDIEIEPLPAGTIDGILASSPPLEQPGPDVGGLTMQREILADGVVTAEQYDQAMEAAVSCIERDGYDAHVVRDGGVFDPAFPLGLVFIHGVEVGPGDADPEQLIERCRAQWSWQIEQVWIAQVRHAFRDWGQSWSTFRDCANEHGLGFYEPPPEGDERRGSLEDCLP